MPLLAFPVLLIDIVMVHAGAVCISPGELFAKNLPVGDAIRKANKLPFRYQGIQKVLNPAACIVSVSDEECLSDGDAKRNLTYYETV